MPKRSRIVLVAIGLVAAAAGWYAWTQLQPEGLPDGIAAGNGRIEAVEIDISTRIAGRIRDIMVREGDFVVAGQPVALMDTDQLMAQRREADAQLRRARIGVETARSLVTQREAEKTAAEALIAQRNAERDAAAKRLGRTEMLSRRGSVSDQILDDDRANLQGMVAAVAAARAQSAAADAAIGAARSGVVDAEAGVEAAAATLERIDADIADAELKAPRDGRIQFRVAQPGEVLSAGGHVLNMVDLADVYMTFFLSTSEVGQVALGTEVRLVLDAAPQYVIPAEISFVSDVAQFTPKTVETAIERQKLMFRVRARIAPDLLEKYIRQVKTGLPGMAYVRLTPDAAWPKALDGTLVQ
ncbi:glycoside hydrolase family 43 [Tistrella bauzanensis]|uniref:Glycoside hydrolase family 43 n=1 Tax=Tistrella bauzanensis TaxID=657419 RepID=A0ABQ1IA44_9PROT|nr:HlyD family efflux transporter periplasmic adaptor subunit [Tistrella bauzanensis]GGB28563.1 glycoside hydrolase family 43 [Tistrella bauzanensis]